MTVFVISPISPFAQVKFLLHIKCVCIFYSQWKFTIFSMFSTILCLWLLLILTRWLNLRLNGFHTLLLASHKRSTSGIYFYQNWKEILFHRGKKNQFWCSRVILSELERNFIAIRDHNVFCECMHRTFPIKSFFETNNSLR